MKIIECTQYSPEWWEARCGIPTASQFDRIITAAKAEPSKQMDGYIAELIADKASLTPPFFTERGGHTAEMRNGIDCEPEARRFYEADRGLDVRLAGFIATDDARFGCSPDGLVVDGAGEIVGGLELKCPMLKTQAGYLLKGGLPDDYKAQVHGQLLVTGLPWVDFLSYSPGLPALLVRVEPNDFTKKLASALEVFWEKYQQALAYIEGRPYVAEQMRESIGKGGAA
jgi:hypothetical protein